MPGCQRCGWWVRNAAFLYRVKLITDDEQNGSEYTVCKNCAAQLALCVPPMMEGADAFIKLLHVLEDEL